MSVPAAISSALAAFIGSVRASAPLNSATRLQLSALQEAGTAVLAQVDAAAAASGAPLDAGDPTGFVGDFPGILLALATASEDQTTLSDVRGLVGRALFNIAQAASG